MEQNSFCATGVRIYNLDVIKLYKRFKRIFICVLDNLTANFKITEIDAKSSFEHIF